MENLNIYQNADGTYTSPRNNKNYKSLKAFRAHWFYAGTTDPESFSKRLKDVVCQFCEKEVISSNIKKHEKYCFLNPQNIKFCKVCNQPIKNYKSSKGTCSHKCANTHFRTGDKNGAWTGENYQLICFASHKKQCIVCGEEKIVAVHHNDQNHKNNSADNLIPLCPTHHQYVHSRYKDEVQPIIDRYIMEWKNNNRV